MLITVSTLRHLGNKKNRFWGTSPLSNEANPLHTVVGLHYTHHTQMACLIKGGKSAQNAQKQIIIITNFEQTCSLVSITIMAFIQYVVMIHLSEQVGLIELNLNRTEMICV